MGTHVTPYQTSDSKKDQVAQMFNNIAGRYDFMNHFLSMGIDILWRKKAINCLRKKLPGDILDIATGTGDFAFEAMALNPDSIIGVDISEGMMAVGRDKIRRRGLEGTISLQYGDSADLPFEAESFDAITVAFGVRNYEDLEGGLTDMHRVLRKDGVVCILEFSKPTKFPVKQAYAFYSGVIIPALGKLMSRDRAAYTYLPQSVAAFPEGNDFLDIMKKVGYQNVARMPLTGGIATIYLGRKS